MIQDLTQLIVNIRPRSPVERVPARDRVDRGESIIIRQPQHRRQARRKKALQRNYFSSFLIRKSHQLRPYHRDHLSIMDVKQDLPPVAVGKHRTGQKNADGERIFNAHD